MDLTTEKESSATSAHDRAEARDVEFYSQAVAAYFSTSLELDKSYLTISVAALGFWITLITTLKENLFVSPLSVGLCMVSLAAFAVTCLLVLYIFHCNRKLILETLEASPGDDPGPTNQKIKALDRRVRWCFGIAVAALMCFGIITVDRYFTFRNVTMSKSDSNDNGPVPFTNGLGIESFGDMHAARAAAMNNGKPDQTQPTPASDSSGQPNAPVADSNKK